MKAIVVYESFWGNTAAVARAIGEGIGGETAVLTTDQATAEVVAEADLVVVGSPVIGFALPLEKARQDLAAQVKKGVAPPDLSHPSLRSWLAALRPGKGRFAAFETRIWWSLGGATGAIERGLAKAGYTRGQKRERFIVQGGQGPLRDGELDRAKAWGARLAKAM